MKCSLAIVSLVLSLAACGGGGGGDSPAPAPSSHSIETMAGAYVNDVNPNSRLIIDTDGRFYSIAVDRPINPTVAGVSVGDVTVANSGAFGVSGTTYRNDYRGLFYSGIDVAGNIVDDRLQFTTQAFGATTSGSASRAGLATTGNIPSGQWSLSWNLVYPLARTTTLSAPSITLSTSRTTALSASAQAAPKSWTGNINGCSFAGSSTDSGRGFARITIQFSDSSLCLYPTQLARGIISYNPAQQVIVFILRMDPAPHRILFGTGA
jgi:hypothetical protein